MALLGSKQHTEGDSRLWTVGYSQWLDEDAAIDTVDVTSDSTTCTIGETTVLGPDVKFLLVGGTLNERLTVTLVMTDNLGNIKTDTIAFTVIAA
jgi:hypothetical protein